MLPNLQVNLRLYPSANTAESERTPLASGPNLWYLKPNCPNRDMLSNVMVCWRCDVHEEV